MKTPRRPCSAFLLLFFVAATSPLLSGCTAGGADPDLDAPESEEVADSHVSFEEFEAMLYREPDTGIYIVEGDIPIGDREALREYYDRYVHPSALIIEQVGGADVRWSEAQKLNLTYCVSSAGFGDRYAEVVEAMSLAAGAWEKAAQVDFIHKSAQDGSCTAANGNVLFDVRPAPAFAGYHARAFFPDDPRASRNVLIGSSAFTAAPPESLVGILRHELGHVLGFRHEHLESVDPLACSNELNEDSTYRPITTYDSASVMHYSWCFGTGHDLTLTTRDKIGAASIYGVPNLLNSFSGASPWNDFMVYTGWNPMPGDFNGDGLDDIAQFTVNNTKDVLVSLSTGSSFEYGDLWHDSFAGTGEVPRVGDVDDDGLDDIITFRSDSSGDVFVARSSGSSFGFSIKWHDWFAPNDQIPWVGDVDGDRKADIISFANDAGGDVHVARSTGDTFGASAKWHEWFAPTGEIPRVGDFDGDGRTDIATFVPSSGRVWVALSTGTGFGPSSVWHSSFLTSATQVPWVGDVDNDGQDDIVLFTLDGSMDTFVALSIGSSFGARVKYSESFALPGEIPRVGDWNGDGMADCVTFTQGPAMDAYVALGRRAAPAP